jgi:lysine N6-hydroxylase
VAWISRRPTFAPLDETHFVNEWFTPGFVERFHGLPAGRRQALEPVQKLAGDGISPATIREIYAYLYERRHVVGDGETLVLLPAREVTGLQRHGSGVLLALTSQLDGLQEQVVADVVVLATGFRWQLPECLSGLKHRFALDGAGRPILGLRYRLAWDGPAGARIYLQNGGEHSHGIADAQLSLMAWRAASIVNDVMQQPVYDLTEAEPVIQWSRSAVPCAWPSPDEACFAPKRRAMMGPSPIKAAQA